jgi:hypothetical protein
MLIFIELFVVIALIAFALVSPSAGIQHFESAFAKFDERFSQLSRRRWLSLLLVAVASIGLRIAVLPIMPVPAPTVDDEFSYLLQADTFLHGRLTNPTHGMWTHFETFHTNMLPTYQSKFPPAQGAVLAVGTLLGGRPIVGVWLGMAAMCAATCWMLQEWISPECALVGGLLLAVRLSAFSYWGNSYWGGAVPATGGALVLGALARMKNSTRLRDALLMGLGVAILAASRPFEGAVLCVPVAATLLSWWQAKRGPDLKRVVRNAIVPLALCVALTGAMIGYYDWKLTGHALLLPYQLNERTYFVSPLFIFQHPRPQPAYRNDALRDFYSSFDLPQFEETQSLRGLLASWYSRFQKIWLVLLGPILTLPLVLALFVEPRQLRLVLRDWRNRILIWGGLLFVAALAVEVYGLPHYAAPAAPLLIFAVLLAMRRLRQMQFRGKPTGLFLFRAIPLVCLLMFVLRAAAAPLHIDVTSYWPPTWYNSATQVIPRTAFERMIDAQPGKHLVIVYYKPDADEGTFHEWVYNAADIDASKIVWAWDMGDAKNRELIDYFKGRQIWRVSMDGTPVLAPATPTAAVARIAP